MYCAWKYPHSHNIMMTPSGAFFDPECLKRLCNEFERMTLPIAEVNEPILDNRLTLEDELASHNKSRSVQLIQHFRSKSDSIEPKLLDQHSLARTVVLDDVAPLSPELDALLRVSKVTKLRMSRWILSLKNHVDSWPSTQQVQRMLQICSC